MSEQLQEVKQYDPFKDINEADQKDQKERQFALKKKKIQDGISKLVDQTVYNEQKYGKDHFSTQLTTMFLEVSLQMTAVIDMMQSLQISFSYLDDAMSFIDETVHFTDDIFKSSLDTKYGFFHRLIRNIRMRRAMRNNRRRITASMNQVMSYFKFSTDLVKGLTTSCSKLQRKMNGFNLKNKQKLEKQKAKGKGSSTGSTPNVGFQVSKETMELIEAKKKEKGLTEQTPKDASSSGQPSTPSNSGSSDISDIL